jgi:hypothetical protein
MELLEHRGVPAVWRDSIAEHLDQIDDLQRRIRPIDHELEPIARRDPRAKLAFDDPRRRGHAPSAVNPAVTATNPMTRPESSRARSRPIASPGPGSPYVVSIELISPPPWEREEEHDDEEGPADDHPHGVADSHEALWFR